MSAMTEAPTPVCFVCGRGGFVAVPRTQFESYQRYQMPVQEAFTELSAAEREQLISGTHPRPLRPLREEKP